MCKLTLNLNCKAFDFFSYLRIGTIQHLYILITLKKPLFFLVFLA